MIEIMKEGITQREGGWGSWTPMNDTEIIKLEDYKNSGERSAKE